MLEIFALPYFIISGVIGWIIFEPFFRVEKSHSLSPAKLATCDLLAIPLPVGVLFLSAQAIMPENIRLPYVQAIAIGTAMGFAVLTLIAGLFLVPKAFQVTFLKRMVVVGIIAPFGMVLTIGWVGFLIWASTHSILYLVPSSIGIGAAIASLRILGNWVCRTESFASC